MIPNAMRLWWEVNPQLLLTITTDTIKGPPPIIIVSGLDCIFVEMESVFSGEVFYIKKDILTFGGGRCLR